MRRKVLSYAEFNEGFRIVVSPDGMLIEATDYHARPLELSREQLLELGLEIMTGASGESTLRPPERRIRPGDDYLEN